MSDMALPPVHLEMHCSWFDLLLTVLHEREKSDPVPSHRRMAQQLADKLMTYTRSFTDIQGVSCVDLRVYPSEAATLIWLLLLELGLGLDCLPDREYSAELSGKKSKQETQDISDGGESNGEKV